jgi:hypothetical protein
MNLSLIATVVTALAACGAAGAAMWGLRYGKGLIDSAVRDRQVDRSVSYHADLTTGEVGAARNRFSRLMFRVGERAFGPESCWRPTWDSLLPAEVGVNKDVHRSRFLGHYPSDMNGCEGQSPLHDLRLVLWCFERIDESRRHKSLIDEQLLVSLIGYHVAWWDLLCRRLEPVSGAHLYSLRQLATWMEEQNWRSDVRNDYRRQPEDDFPGREDEVPIPIVLKGRSADPRRHRGSG